MKSNDWRYEVLNSEFLYIIGPSEYNPKLRIGATSEKQSNSLTEIWTAVKSYKNKPIIMSGAFEGKYMGKREVLAFLKDRIEAVPE